MICPNCKSQIPGPSDQAQTIEILESQIRQLTQKLAFAVDKAADLEDDLRAMRSASPASSTPTAVNPSATPEPSFPTTQSRFAAFLVARRPSIFGGRVPTPTKGTHVRTPTPTSNLSLEEQLQMERVAREQADEKVASMTAELEELSQSLFEEANAMVKVEREKCSRLEARLQIMESREDEKRRRLTELEKAIGRITRVRNVLENKSTNAVSSVG